MAEVRLENITKFYGHKLAVDNISFTCKEGKFFSILGPTEAGKSTTLKMIAGIEPISSGKIYFNNRLVNNLPPYKRNVSMAFESYNLYSHFTVYENIAFPLRAPRWKLKLSPQEERKKVLEIADFLGIGELLDRKPQHLSGGQKQRVSLARALVRRVEVYLLDEPIAHLDVRLKFTTQTLLREFAINYKSTIIYVTHDYREALSLSDKMLVLRRGKIEQFGSPEEIYYKPATDFVGRMMGEPPMNMIDGELIVKENETIFKANNDFSIKLSRELTSKAKRVAKKEDEKLKVRLGIKCEDIRIDSHKISENSFQLPLYSVVHEVENAVAAFELKDCFLYVKTKGVNGYCNYRTSEMLWLDFDLDHTFFYEKTVEISKT